ncbi:MAG: pyruvate carboxyltransferase [Acidobacteriota bacterium]
MSFSLPITNDREERELFFSDTTLREGEQMPGVALGLEDKVEIARALTAAGVRSIEAGFPACAASEIRAMQAIVREVHGPVMMALCRTLPRDIDAANEALAGAPPYRRSASLFLGTSPSHRDYKFHMTKSQVIDTIVRGIEYARQSFRLVAFSAEDASRTERDFLCEVYRHAIDAGATVIGFPDTLGVLTPGKTKSFIRHLQNNIPNLGRVMIAVHFHNDLGLATANTLAAVEEGVQVVQCTVNGLGERAGNAPLEEVALAIILNHEEYRCRISIDATRLTSLCRLVAERTGIPISPHKPVVGSNIFATEAGIHQDGILKHPDTYLPFPPRTVGADQIRLVLGKHSGRAGLAARLEEMGYKLSPEEINRVSEQFKEAGKLEWADERKLLNAAVAKVRAEAANESVPGKDR